MDNLMSYLDKLQPFPFLETTSGSLILQRGGLSSLDLTYARSAQLRNSDLLTVLEAISGESHFRYDEATKAFFFDQLCLPEKDLEMLPLQISRKYAINFPSGLTRQAVEALAFQNSFDSYQQELRRIGESVSPICISNLSTRYFRTSEPIFDKFLELWLVNWVKRLLEPGAYHRTMLVLQGPQNIGKDQFAKILAGASATTSVGCNANFSDKDLLTTFNSKSILIFDELEQTTGRVVEGALKSFLSETSDNFVGKYKSHSQYLPRRYSCWGSCNKPTFLTDSTGNTRFHVIPVNLDPHNGERIDLELLRSERLGIIAGALALYRQSQLGSYQLELSTENLLVSERLNRAYLNDSQFEEPLADFLEGRTTTSVREIRGFLGLSDNHLDKRVDKEIRTVLELLGWKPLGQSRAIPCLGGRQSTKPWILKSATTHDYHELTPFYESLHGCREEF